MLTLKKVKELVGAPSHAKRTPSPKMLYEEGIVLLRREFDQGSHLTVYNSGYVLFSAGKRNTVFHIHDCCGDYAYDTKTLPISKWKQEYADLKEQRDTDYTKLKATRAEVAELQKIRKCVDIALKAEQPEQTQNRTKRHEQER